MTFGYNKVLPYEGVLPTEWWVFADVLIMVGGRDIVEN
jgi:hypothetical protein